MSEHGERVQPPAAAAPPEDAVARLVRLAGARPPVPTDRATRVEDRVRAAWAESVGTRRRRRVGAWVAGLAAAAAVALALGVAWNRATRPAAPAAVVASVERVAGTATATGAAGSRPLAAGESLRAGERLATGEGGRVALRLPGGPSLRLDTLSRVTLAAPAQLQLEQGALYVDSQGGTPVTVRTALGTVEERGTQFEVRVAPAGTTAPASVRVRVREGSVQLAARLSRPDQRRSWEAPAGAELLLDANGRLARGTVPLHGDAWEWVQEIAPSFQLEGRTLGDFLAWAGRESGSRLAWADPARATALRGVVLHGSIDGLPPDQALAAVLPTCGLASRRDGSSIVIFVSSR